MYRNSFEKKNLKMPKNTFGGNKAKKGKKNISSQVREIEYVTEDGESYGVVVSVLGDQRFGVQLITESARGETIVCHLSNGHKRRLGYIKKDDHVLIALRQLGKSNNGDIIFSYTPDEVQLLVSRGEIIDISISSSTGATIDTGYTFTSGTREESVEVGAGAAAMSSRVRGAATEINIDTL